LLVKVKHGDQSYVLDMDKGVDLSIESDFSGTAPIFYNADQPKVEPECSDDFIGDLKQGGSCNVPIVSLNIHCTGTHTECISHVFDSNDKISDHCPKGLVPACIITIEPERSSVIKESYHGDISDDLLLTKNAIRKKISTSHDALIIRTHPNDRSKLSRNYDEQPAPFFTNDAIEYINELDVKHLLVDTPSIDKADDGGLLGNHRRFFKQGKTISELLFIPDALQDGFGFLQFQIPNWSLDSAPSRPIFFSV